MTTTDVQQIKGDLREVKNLLSGSLAPGSHQQPVGATLDEIVVTRDVQQMKEDLREVKNLLGSLGSRQQPVAAASSLCEY